MTESSRDRSTIVEAVAERRGYGRWCSPVDCALEESERFHRLARAGRLGWS